MRNTVQSLRLFAVFFWTVASLASMTRILPQGPDQVTRRTQGVPYIFKEIESALRRDSAVPPRLPAFLPDVDAAHPIYPVIQSAGRSGYDIVLATVLPCEGQNNCLYGTLRGSSSPINVDGDPGDRIMLHGRLKGQYIKSVCHAFCTESYVKWREKGFFYVVGIKAEKREAVIKAANSAIAAAR